MMKAKRKEEDGPLTEPYGSDGRLELWCVAGKSKGGEFHPCHVRLK